MNLTIELVPETSWYTNVRSNVTATEWDIIRRKCYSIADNKCQICGNQGYDHKVECHEIWEYDNENKIQKLIGLIALCPTCHKVKHAGLSQIRGETQLVIRQLMKVNNMNKKEAIKYFEESFVVWRERSKFNWAVDVKYIKEFLKK